MASNTTFCLKSSKFPELICQSLKVLRSGQDFADVTLACDDGYQIEAHKVFLAATSPFFKSLLQRTKISHPIVFMRGMKREDLDAIVDFLYFGEANVHQENLDAFLALAEELKLKGLTGQQDVSEDSKEAYEKEMTTNLPSKGEKWISSKRRNNFASKNELAIREVFK